MTPIALLAPLLQTAAVPHAELHPADPAGFVVVHDLAATGAAYERAPTLEFVRDERVVALIEAFSGAPFDTSLVSPAALFDLALEQLPPEATALGLDDLLEDGVGFSLSLELGPDFEPQVLDGLRYGFAVIELGELEQRLRSRMDSGGGAAPADLAAVVGDDAALGIDPWGRPYLYELVDDLGPRLRCLGADGAPGGTGFGTDLELTLLGLPEPEPSVLDGLLASVGLQLVVEFRSTAGAEQVMNLIDMTLAGAPPEIRHEEFALGQGAAALVGRSFTAADAPLDVQGWVGRNGNRVVFGAFANRSGDVAARLADAAPSLSDSPALAAALDALGPQAGVPLSTAWGGRAPWGLYDLVIDSALAAGLRELVERDADEQIPAVLWDLLADFEPDQRPLLERRALAASTFVTEVLRPGAPSPCRYFPRGAIARDELEILGADAAAVYATQLDLTAVYDLLLESAAGFRGLDPEAYHQRGIELLGIDLRADLLALLEPTLVVSLDPIRGPATPPLMLYAKVSDPERVSRSLSTLVESIAAAFPDDFTANTRPYRGLPLARLALRGLDLGPIGIEPSFGVVGDRLVLGLSGAAVKKELRRLSAGELEAHPLLDAERTPWSDDLSSVGYLDWATFVGAGYDTARTFAGFMGDDLDVLPIDLASLPPGSLFNDHFAPNLWLTRQAPAGQRTVLTSSLGPELQLLIEAGSLSLGQSGGDLEALFGGSDVAAERVMEATPELDPEQRTREALRRVSVALQIHFYEFEGSYPEDLAALARPTPNFPRGCLDGEPLPADAWGAALRYRAADDRTGYRLWSVGPDGVDQSGGGDDLLTTVP